MVDKKVIENIIIGSENDFFSQILYKKVLVSL